LLLKVLILEMKVLVDLTIGLDASFIAYRNYYNHKVTLYGFEEFFIEVFYFPEENRITSIEGMELDSPKIDLYISASLKDK